MIAVLGFGAISARGRGEEAVAAERPGTAVARDAELSAAGLKRPFCARAEISGEGDRATLLLAAALEDCIATLEPGWREKRIGLALGTSSGGMRAFETHAPGIAGTYAGPVAAAVERAGLATAPSAFVLGACASSAIAIGLGKLWLEADRCDLVLAGGFDAVSVFVAAGFECLRATCGERGPRPFRLDRDGLALGEGAAVLALARSGERKTRSEAPTASRVHAFITGFDTTCDAHHLTSPDPKGGGLARAAKTAAIMANTSQIGLVSAHGTATHHNDAAEAQTLVSLGLDAPVFSFKGAIGHTLGAAGALETLAAIRALTRGEAPPTHGAGPAEPGALLRDAPTSSTARTALKLSSAFGGANAALVVSLDPAADEALLRRGVFLTRAVRVDAADLEPAALAEQSGYPIDRITRSDDLVRYALAATTKLRQAHGSLQGAGIILGLGLATIETNAKFLAKIPRGEPRRFPYTTPNAAAGECAVAFGLTGPAFAVGGGPHGGLEAIAIAADLVAAGVADRIVVVAADEAGDASARVAPGTKSGAVAVIVQNTPSAAKLDAWSVRYAPRAGSDLPPMHAHAALAPLVDGEPATLEAAVPWGGRARVAISWA